MGDGDLVINNALTLGGGSITGLVINNVVGVPEPSTVVLLGLAVVAFGPAVLAQTVAARNKKLLPARRTDQLALLFGRVDWRPFEGLLGCRGRFKEDGSLAALFRCWAGCRNKRAIIWQWPTHGSLSSSPLLGSKIGPLGKSPALGLKSGKLALQTVSRQSYGFQAQTACKTALDHKF